MRDVSLYLLLNNGHLEIVRELLKHQVHINEKDSYGDTSLHCAVKLNHLEIVRELLNHQANSNEKDKNGCTPLHYASMYGNLAMVKELIPYSNLSITNNIGKTALDLSDDKIRNFITNYREVPTIKEPKIN